MADGQAPDSASDSPSEAAHAGAPRRRLRAVWTVGAVGLGVAALLSAGWILRVPLAEALIRNHLQTIGVESDFRIERLDLGGAALSAVTLGPALEPEAAAEGADVRFAWRGVLPAVDSIRLVGPRLRAQLNEEGLSLGSLDRFFDGPPSGRRPELPDLTLVIEDGQGLLDTPFGALPITFSSEGRFGRDFSAAIHLPRTSQAMGADLLHNAEGEILIASNTQGFSAAADVRGSKLVRRELELAAFTIQANASGPNDLSRLNLDLSLRAGDARAPGFDLVDGEARVRVHGALQERGLAFANWTADADAQFRVLLLGAAGADTAEAGEIDGLRLFGRMVGNAEGGRGDWRLSAQHAMAADWRADDVGGQADVRIVFGDQLQMAAQGRLQSQEARLEADGRATLARAWPTLGGTPLAPLLISARDGVTRGLGHFSVQAPFSFSLRNGASEFRLSEQIEAQASSGAVARLKPLRGDAPMFSLRLADGAMNVAAVLELSGGGLPNATWTIDEFVHAENEPIQANGALSIPDWRTQSGQLSAPELDTQLRLHPDGRGELRLIGPATLSGPIGGGSVSALSLPLDLLFGWGQGFRVATLDNQCLPVRFQRVVLPGVELVNGAAAVCPAGGAFFFADANGAISGGFTLDRVDLVGHMAGEPAQRTRVQAGRIVGRFSGNGAQMILDVQADAPRMTVLMEETREIAITGGALTARTISSNGTWRADGQFRGGVFTDPALPANVTEIAARWAAEPQGEDARIHVLDGAARLTDKAPPDAPEGRLAAFNPIRLANVRADLSEGRLIAEGEIALEAGNRSLGVFDARHDLESAVGDAHVAVRALTFSPTLQADDLTLLARGLIENARGPIDADFNVDWSPETISARGRLALNNVSAASSTLPIIENVSGEIVFDDLFTLRTPPGQRIHVGALNPGIAVREGDIQFQLLGDGRLALEGARWPFAGGALSVQPTTLTLNSEETRFSLVLRDVDVQQLLQQLNVPDLTATGRVEGEFPLLLTPTTAFIENGELRAAQGGGTIAYTGSAGDNAQGAARIAFGALSSFRFDSLTLHLSGDLGGEVVSDIVFSGRNQAAVDLSDMTPGGGVVPTLGGANIPFRFNVRVRAPFRRLAETAAGISDVSTIIDRVQTPQTPPEADNEARPQDSATPTDQNDTPVIDQAPPPPR
ncbi:MAG: YdbH domain-containing protein [Hyphomonadaceae bacterium]